MMVVVPAPMMMMVMVAADDDDPAMMMVVMMVLRELHGRLLLAHALIVSGKHRRRVRHGFEQIGIA